MWYGGELPASSFPAVNLTAEQRNLLALVSYVNAKGQEWSIPTGEYAFNVSSKPNAYPSFISGDINPLDVKVGDKILFSKYGGTEVKIDGEEHLIMREDDILGIIE